MYAVIDVETTGLSPRAGHRIIEIAVVQAGLWGEFENQWTSLIDPGRNPGPTHVHGLAQEHLDGAPKFWEVVPLLSRLLSGRTVVAHNLPFDWGFIRAEFEALRLPLPAVRGLDTMELATSFLPSAPRNLIACCQAAGIATSSHHSALDDARATAQLFHSFLTRMRPTPPPWGELAGANMRIPWPHLPAHPFTAKLRSTPPPAPPASVPLANLSDAMPRIDSEPMADPYLQIVDRCLSDRQLSREERGELAMVAHDLGLKPAAVTRLHREYLTALTRIAMADDRLSTEELSDLQQVASLLELSTATVEKLIGEVTSARARKAAVASGFQVGDTVCFTGDETEDREALTARAQAAGLIVKTGVSKSLSVLVIAAGYDNTTKARQARGYDIPTLTLSEFDRKLADLKTRMEADPGQQRSGG